jgi:serine/threonine-protein kinase
VADDRLYLQARDQLTPTPLGATEGTGAASPRAVFFSADGQWVGYWADGALRRISVHGGASVRIAAAEIPAGASWGLDGTIVYAQTTGVWRVLDTGGQPPTQIMKVDPITTRVQSPQLLPGGWLLATVTVTEKALDESDIVVQPLDGGARQSLQTGKDARYVSSGHLLFTLGGVLHAQRFDPLSLTLSGRPEAVVEDIFQSPNRGAGPAQYAVSESGTLVYVTAAASAAVARTVTWVDRQGHETPINARSRGYLYPRLSPDNTRIALDALGESRDIWIWHLERNTETLLTDDRGDDRSPTWTVNSERIIFTSDRAGYPTLFSQSSDGLDDATILSPGTRMRAARFAHSATPDGKWLVFRQSGAAGTGSEDADLMRLSLDDPEQLEPLLTTPASEFNGEVSPNGHFLAYQSDRSGQFQVFVRRFPHAKPGEEWPIDVGTEPLWSPTGTELFYRSLSGGIMSVQVRDEPTIPWTATTPVEVLSGAAYHLGVEGTYPIRTYDVSRDGRRFLMLKNGTATAEQRPVRDFVRFDNWLEELKRLVPPE